ncbi:MAG TPA: FAD-dependent oxidoreductase, partial [Stellaceae bacterium]|nr:FAD-dependent oxidoreductase [Stellaceae bacterium]
MPFGGYFRAAIGCLGLVLGLAAGVPQSATAQTVPSQLPNLIQGVLEQYRNAPPPMAAPMPAPQQQPSQGNAASSAWLAVDPRVTGCLRDSYRIDAQAYAASGIGPSDPRVAGYVSQCNEKITREVKLEWKKYYATQEWEKLDPRVASCLQSRFKINIAQLEAKGLGPRDKPVLLKQCETIVAEEKSKPNKPKETQTARDTEPAGKPDAEIVFWESIRSSVSADEYREYLKRYPEGQFATIAHLRIEELQKQASPHKEAAAPSAITGRRVALIVGNAGYKHVPYLDVTNRRVLCDIGPVEYDTLIVAAGARSQYFSHPEWEKDAPDLKSIESATQIRHKILYAFEAAERESDPEKRRDWLTFVVVGAGPTGVELAGALGEIANDTLKNDFRSIRPQEARILLLDGSTRVLPPYPPDLSAKAEKALIRLSVRVRTGVKVTGVDEQGVTIDAGKGSERIG